jgi:hypothetical protein
MPHKNEKKKKKKQNIFKNTYDGPMLFPPSLFGGTGAYFHRGAFVGACLWEAEEEAATKRGACG